MSNMSYCRFQNTYDDLRDCYESLKEGIEVSKEEQKSKEKLIELCKKIIIYAKK